MATPEDPLGGSKKSRKWLQEGKTRMKTFWESEYKPGLVVPENTKGERTKAEIFERFLEGRSEDNSPTSLDEYDKWCYLSPFRHDNALSYWIENRSKWPRLAQMAIDIFSIPAMSAESERVFSLTGAMCTPRRSRLNAESMQASQCLRAWHNAGIIKDLFPGLNDDDLPDAEEDAEEDTEEDVEELAQALASFGLEEDSEDEEGYEDE
jgi:hAT family C-terminal dimerisation region